MIYGSADVPKLRTPRKSLCRELNISGAMTINGVNLCYIPGY